MTALDMTDWPLVYVAGPYSNDPTGNTRRSFRTCRCCGTSTTPTPSSGGTRTTWRSSPASGALFRFRGESTGADRGVAFAHERGIPVFSVSLQRVNASTSGDAPGRPTGRYPRATPPKVAR